MLPIEGHSAGKLIPWDLCVEPPGKVASNSCARSSRFTDGPELKSDLEVRSP